VNETKTNTGATVYKEVCEYYKRSEIVDVTQGHDDVTIRKIDPHDMFSTNELRFIFSVMVKYDSRLYITKNLNAGLTAVLWKWWRR
jgi:hypothetical protein